MTLQLNGRTLECSQEGRIIDSRDLAKVALKPAKH